MKNFYTLSSTLEHDIVQLLREGNLSVVDGGLLSTFESRVAAFFGHELAVATCNGTAAIHLAYFALNIQTDDEVLVCTYGFHAMITPLLQMGGKPVFCDVDPDTLTIDIADLRQKITTKTKAIMVLHPWGNVADIDALQQVAREFSLFLISDSSHAHGALWGGKPLGAYFDIVCASFGKGKLITGGELGVFSTTNDEFYDRALLYSHPNRVPGAYKTNKYKHISNNIGLKYRPHAVALQLAANQLETFSTRNEKLIKNVGLLLSMIENIPKLRLVKTHPFAKRNYWKLTILGVEKDIESLHSLAEKNNIVLEKHHYETLLHEDTIVTQYYGCESIQHTFPHAHSLKNCVVQIDAIQLFNDETLQNYLDFFSSLGGEFHG